MSADDHVHWWMNAKHGGAWFKNQSVNGHSPFEIVNAVHFVENVLHYFFLSIHAILFSLESSSSQIMN